MDVEGLEGTAAWGLINREGREAESRRRGRGVNSQAFFPVVVGMLAKNVLKMVDI